MSRPDAKARREHLRAHLTGPWDTHLLERISGLGWKTLNPDWQVAKEELRGVLMSSPRDNGWPGVRFDPDRFVELLRRVYAAQTDRDALYRERNGGVLHTAKRRPNMGVLRSAIREHAALHLHMHLHAALWWMGEGAQRETNRMVCCELLKIADRCDAAQRKAYDAALRIGGKHALDAVAVDMSGGVFRPVEAP